MILPGALGYLAAGLVLLTFGMRSMVPMRMVATLSNLAFIAYGLSLGLTRLGPPRAAPAAQHPPPARMPAAGAPPAALSAGRAVPPGHCQAALRPRRHPVPQGRFRARCVLRPQRPGPSPGDRRQDRLGRPAWRAQPDRTGPDAHRDPPLRDRLRAAGRQRPLSRQAPRAASPEAGRAKPAPPRELVPSCRLGAQAKRLTPSPLPGSVPGIARLPAAARPFAAERQGPQTVMRSN